MRFTIGTVLLVAACGGTAARLIFDPGGKQKLEKALTFVETRDGY